jgi:hypothetical protein
VSSLHLGGPRSFLQLHISDRFPVLVIPPSELYMTGQTTTSVQTWRTFDKRKHWSEPAGTGKSLATGLTESFPNAHEAHLPRPSTSLITPPPASRSRTRGSVLARAALSSLLCISFVCLARVFPCLSAATACCASATLLSSLIRDFWPATGLACHVRPRLSHDTRTTPYGDLTAESLSRIPLCARLQYSRAHRQAKQHLRACLFVRLARYSLSAARAVS